MPTACVSMNKHALNDRPSPGVAILWTSLGPRLSPVLVPPVAPYSYCCLHRFLSGYSSNRFGRSTVQFAWSASSTSPSDVWLAARWLLPEIWIATGPL